MKTISKSVQRREAAMQPAIGTQRGAKRDGHGQEHRWKPKGRRKSEGFHLEAGKKERATLVLRNGHEIKMRVDDGWLIIEGDSTLTVRPLTERSLYIRPVGYVGMWVPGFAPQGPSSKFRDNMTRDEMRDYLDLAIAKFRL